MASISPLRLQPRPGAADPDPSAARWTFDISATRALIESFGATRPAHWVEAVIGSVRIADVDHNIVHLVGPYAGRERMIGQPLIAYHPPESWPTIAALIVTALANPGAELVRQVTSLAFADCVIRLSADAEDPDILFMSVSGRVIDERSFWAVRASEARYRNLIHHLPSALIQVDSQPITAIFDDLRGRGVTDIARYLEQAPELPRHATRIAQVIDANRSAVQLLGADSPDQLIGPIDYVFAEAPETARRALIAHFEGQRNYSELMKLRTLDGRLIDVQLSLTFPAPPERLDVTLLSFEDVSDRLRTEAQLRQLQADYTRAARISMLGELATSIAHEVNQPLSAIVTNAETSLRWLSRDDPNLAKVGQLTARVAESARRASEIVQRIRAMAARRPPERVLLDLNEIVDEAVLFVRHEIESRSIALSLDLGGDLPLVLGDRVQLQQVIVNLLLNGAQAITQGGVTDGRIALGTGIDADGLVRFSIHDSGPGIAAENLDRIFESFFTTKEEGIGIGLAMCQSIVAAHGGTIAASNRAGGGAVFLFSLPPAADT